MKLAQKANLPYPTVRDIMAGISGGRRSTQDAIAKALGCSVAELYKPPQPTKASDMLELEQTLAGMGRQIERITKENEALRAQSPIPGLTSEDLEKIQFMIATYEKLKFLLPEDFFEILCRATPAKIEHVMMILEHDDEALRQELEEHALVKSESELKSS